MARDQMAGERDTERVLLDERTSRRLAGGAVAAVGGVGAGDWNRRASGGNSHAGGRDNSPGREGARGSE